MGTFSKSTPSQVLLSMANAGLTPMDRNFSSPLFAAHGWTANTLCLGEVIDRYDVVKKVESYSSDSGATKAKVVVCFWTIVK